jgi:protein phosphatase
MLGQTELRDHGGAQQPISLGVGNAQIIGDRTEQQDAFGFSDKDDECFVRHGGLLAVVADGMGGHAYGGEASRIAVKAFLQNYMTKPAHQSIPDALNQALKAANQSVCAFAENTGATGNCGTTLIAAAVQPASLSLHWIGAGDSRLFLFRDPQWVQINNDTNFGNQLLRDQIKGIPVDLSNNDKSELQGLTSFLGLQELDEIDRSIRAFKLQSMDWLVLCTDGVYDTLSKDEMVDCLIGDPNFASELVVKAISEKKTSHQDNASVAIIACDFDAAANMSDKSGYLRKALILILAFGLPLIMATVIAFLVGLNLGQYCGPASQLGIWGQIESTLDCLKEKLQLN